MREAARQPRRILVVTNMWPTAAEPAFGSFVREQVTALRARELTVEPFVIAGRPRPLAYPLAVPRLRRRLATGRYDVVHAHYVLSALVAWLAGARRPDRPLVVTHHGIEVFEGWQAVLARWVTARADRTLVISDAMAEHLALGPESVVPCGVDLERFEPGSRAAARAALGLPPDRPLVAWIGADRPEKQLWLARAAVDRLRADRPDARLLVVSGVPHNAVPRYVQASDVLLVTSTREGGPLVVKEALACNRPVVSTDVGDVAAVTAGIAGCHVVDATPDALAAGLRRALDHGPVEGRAAVARYGQREIAEQVAAVYRRLLDGRDG